MELSAGCEAQNVNAVPTILNIRCEQEHVVTNYTLLSSCSSVTRNGEYRKFGITFLLKVNCYLIHWECVPFLSGVFEESSD